MRRGLDPVSVLVSHEVGMPLQQVLHVLEAGSQAILCMPQLHDTSKLIAKSRKITPKQ